MFNVYVSSLFAYKAQFSDLPPEALQAYRTATQQVTRAPWQAVPYAVLTEGKMVGLPIDIRDIAAVAFAAKSPALGRSQVVSNMRAASDAFRGQEETSLDPGRSWHASSTLLTLRRCWHSDTFRRLREVDGDHPVVQRRAYEAARGTAELGANSLRDVLMRRPGRWSCHTQMFVGSIFVFGAR